MDFERLARDFTQNTQINASAEVAIPCQKCGSAVLWMDAGGGRHCPDCDPPVVPAMVRRRVVISHGTGPRGSDHLVDIGGERARRAEREEQSRQVDAVPIKSIDDYWASLPSANGIPTPEQCAAARGLGLKAEAAVVKNSRKRRSKR